MFIKTAVICTLLAIAVHAGTVKKDTGIVVQVTNNTLVPSITYTVDAVDALKEAYSIYLDENQRADAYLELFGAKYPGEWNVAIGYTTILTKSTIYVEASVSGGSDDLKKSDKKAMLVRIFN